MMIPITATITKVMNHKVMGDTGPQSSSSATPAAMDAAIMLRTRMAMIDRKMCSVAMGMVAAADMAFLSSQSEGFRNNSVLSVSFFVKVTR